ncbi:MAG: carboxypeptidase-like regulatory domain-containing protein [Candidatus Thermoplasmatota archaeon]
MRLLPLGLVALLTLAGCAASDEEALPSSLTNFDDLEGEATATTGIIRGVVVDTTITPIAKATVTVNGATKAEKVTDDQGRFLVEGLEPGTYLVKATAPFHFDSQTTVEVVAGVSDPPITKVQLEPLFDQKPYSVPIKQTGYFECSQAGAGVYASSNCVTDHCPIVLDPAQCNDLPTKAMDNLTSQNREWHMDVGPGWQQMVFEMTWTPTAQGTSAWMGMVVSTFKPLRDPSHNFASYSSANPMRFQLDVGVDHESSTADLEPDLIPAEGLSQVSYFVSARKDGNAPTCAVDEFLCTPGIAINQDFEVIIHQFYYGLPREGWSFVAGDERPF